MDRVIVLIDMDCFYVQVEQRANPSLKGKPCAVVQYKKWKGGGIIAVGYEARAKGVTRQMRGDDAKAKCPDIILVRVPEVRDKADLTRYREAGAEVIEVFSKFSSCVERASIDEAYIDLTEQVEQRLASEQEGKVTEADLPNTHIIGYEQKSEDKDKAVLRKEGVHSWLQSIYDNAEMTEGDRRLAAAASIVEEMRAAVYEETGFRCSAGIAHNKVLAKLACGVHKPNKQTVLPHNSVTPFFSTMPIRKVRGFGGKFGEAVTDQLKVEFMAELQQFSLKKLQDCLGDKSGMWVHDICRGLEHEAVSARQLPKSVGCSKNFRGREKLDTKEKVKHWLWSLSKEVVERLEKDRAQNGRKAKSLIVGMTQDQGQDSYHSSRSCAIVKYDTQMFVDNALVLLSKFNKASSNQLHWDPPIINLSISATKFIQLTTEGNSNITSFMIQDRDRFSATQSSQLLSDKTLTKSKPVKPRGIQNFFASKIASKDKPSETMIVEEACVEKSSEATGTAENSPSTSEAVSSSYVKTLPKKSFFMSYLDRKEDKPPIHNSIGYEKVDLTITEDYNENSLDDFQVQDKLNITCDESKDCYDADTDVEYIDDGENGKLDRENSNSACAIKIKDDTKSEQANDEGCKTSSSTDTEGTVTGEKVASKSGTDGNDDMMVCEECGKRVLVWEFPEHSDFHFALKLQKQVQQEQRPLTLENLERPSPVKRKSTTPSSGGRKKTKLSSANMKTLDKFFK